MIGADGRPHVVDNVKLWFANQARNEYDNVMFEPGGAQDVIVKPEGRPGAGDLRCYNVWRGWPVEPKRGDIGPLLRLLDHLFGKQDAQRAYFEDYVAHKVQRPKVKMPVVPILIGPQGSGKTQLGYLIGALFKPHATEIGGRELVSNFNRWAAKTIFILVNELALHDKRVAADMLKALFSDRSLRVNEKYGPEYEHPNYINFLITTNHHNPLHIEPGDRRFFIPELQQLSLDANPKLKHEVIRAQADPGFTAALLYYYNDRSLARFDPWSAPPASKPKDDAIHASFSDLEKFAVELRDNPDRWWRDPTHVDRPNPCDLGEVRDVLMIYDRLYNSSPTAADKGRLTSMGNALTTVKFPSVGVVKTKSGPVRLRVIRNWERWRNAKHGELAAHYDQATSPHDNKERKFDGTPGQLIRLAERRGVARTHEDTP